MTKRVEGTIVRVSDYYILSAQAKGVTMQAGTIFACSADAAGIHYTTAAFLPCA